MSEQVVSSEKDSYKRTTIIQENNPQMRRRITCRLHDQTTALYPFQYSFAIHLLTIFILDPIYGHQTAERLENSVT